MKKILETPFIELMLEVEKVEWPFKNSVPFSTSIHEIVIGKYRRPETLNYLELGALVESIKCHGILQPLLVMRNINAYDIVLGLRRYYAAKIAGLEIVPVVLLESDEAMSELLLLESISHKVLSNSEKVYQKLSNYSGTKTEVLQRLWDDEKADLEPKDNDLAQIEEMICERLGGSTIAEIKMNNNEYKLILKCKNLEALDAIIARLSGEDY